jgi:hypothetical protein
MAMPRDTGATGAMPSQQMQPMNRGVSTPNRLFRTEMNAIGSDEDLRP